MKSLIALALLATALPAVAATLIVGNKNEDSVSFIDLDSGEEVAKAKTGPNPHEVAVSPDGRRAFVVNYGGTTLDLFDTQTRKLIGTCELAPNAGPHGIVWTDANAILVTTERTQTLTLLTPDCGRAEAISTGQEGSHMLAVHLPTGRAYVSNLSDQSVTAIDLVAGKKIADFDAAEEPEGIAVTPDGTELWVANRKSNSVYVLDPASGDRVASIDVGQMPIRLAISPDGKWAVTSDLLDGSISVIDIAARRKVRDIRVSGEADAQQVTLIWSPDGTKLYAAETARSQVAEIDFATGERLRYLPAGEGADGLGIATVTGPPPTVRFEDLPVPQ
ncbi:MAG: beta-propeller fold lactonase family protein [Pacificimonas sp.]